MDETTANVIRDHLVQNGELELDDDFENLGKVFKDTKIYSVFISQKMNGNGNPGTISMGIPIAVLSQKGKISIFSSTREAAVSLLKSYPEKINTVKDLKKVMLAITPITKIEDKGQGTYHVYNGEDFFDIPSGYRVKVKDGKIQSCDHVNKLGEKKKKK